jgi:hypothetical protein
MVGLWDLMTVWTGFAVIGVVTGNEAFAPEHAHRGVRTGVALGLGAICGLLSIITIRSAGHSAGARIFRPDLTQQAKENRTPLLWLLYFAMFAWIPTSCILSAFAVSAVMRAVFG